MPEQKISFVIEARDAFSATVERMGKRSLTSANDIQESNRIISQSTKETNRVTQESANNQAHTQARQSANDEASLAQRADYLNHRNDLERNQSKQYLEAKALENEQIIQQQSEHDLQKEANVSKSQSYEINRTKQHNNQLQQLHSEHEKSLTALQRSENLARLQSVSDGLGRLATISKSQGIRGFQAYKAIASGQSLIAAYLRASKAAAEIPWPLGPVVAAAELASGLALASSIAKQNPPAAHGGLSFVPKEQTYLLDKGERILSPSQNKDLTQFIDKQDSSQGNIVVQQMEVHILENATHIDSLLRMDERDLRELLAVRIYGAMDSLYESGVYPKFATET